MRRDVEPASCSIATRRASAAAKASLRAERRSRSGIASAEPLPRNVEIGECEACLEVVHASRQHFQVPFRIVWTVGQTVEDRERPVGGDARRVDRECFFQRRLDVGGALPGPIKIGEASRGSTFLGAVATACLNAASASSSLPRAYSTPPSCVWALLRSGSVFTAS